MPNSSEEDRKTSTKTRNGKTKTRLELSAAEGSSVHSYFTTSSSVSMVMRSHSALSSQQTHGH